MKSWRPWLECLAIAAAFVLPLHRGKTVSRNNAHTISRRLASTAFVCGLAWLPLWTALKAHDDQGPREAWRQLPAALGLRWQGLLRAVALSIGLTATLYLGPLLMQKTGRGVHLQDDGWRAQKGGAERSWEMAVRDLAAAPVLEEFAFRACMAPLLLLGGATVKDTVLITPLFFGVAHLHHLYDKVTVQQVPFALAVQQVAGQAVYTTAFGAYATWLFIRTGSLAAPVAVHMLCNAVGFPDFDAMAAHQHQPLLSAATGAGVLLFGILLRPATASAGYGGPILLPPSVQLS